MKHNKNGFVVIYVCLFLMTLISMCLIFIGAAKSSAQKSGIEALGRTWQQSVLAEYDLNLKNRYSLFGFYGYPAVTEKKLRFYIEESFKEKANTRWQLESCSLYPYSLKNVEIFRKQMIESGKLSAAGVLVKKDGRIIPVKEKKPLSRDKIFSDLPSENRRGSVSVKAVTEQMGDKNDIGKVLQKGSDTYYQIEYIFGHFNCKNAKGEETQSCFNNEIEYIIAGKKSDEANANYVRNRIIAVREVLNLSYLNGDDKKKQAALAMAELLTPGAAAPATQQSLLALWALAESVNDYHLLMEGYKVPYIKDENSWATDLESAMDNQEDCCIFTGENRGETYEDYLRVFLSVMNEPLRILRVMDVVQMNMRQFYYDNFVLSDYYGGLSFVINVNGKPYELEKTYF